MRACRAGAGQRAWRVVREKLGDSAKPRTALGLPPDWIRRMLEEGEREGEERHRGQRDKTLMHEVETLTINKETTAIKSKTTVITKSS
ncbi:hypothetical protein E2C01_087241 [Portunus trituberculatus]|uniref:Uncharacterized protein n=1 Tax=Portunus trituberculatus TaxID=210409 RepID=A0A5B7JFM8_PORTR|nr:hypothetical protein [Portunus trituberculatus]